METEQASDMSLEEKQTSIWNTVTSFSKYLAITLFVILPFLGGWVGYTFAPEKLVEIEKLIEIEKIIEVEVNKNDSSNSPTPLQEESLNVDSYDFHEYLFKKGGERRFLFAEPSRKSDIKEHGQCEPFDGGLYEFDVRSYKLISSIFVDKQDAPCTLRFVANLGSKYYFSESFSQQQLFVIDIDQKIPELTALEYTHLRINNYPDPVIRPENLILVRAFGESGLSVFDMDTGKSKVIFDDPNYGFITRGLGLAISTKRFTSEEIEFEILPYGEPDESGRRDAAHTGEYITISLQ